MTSLDHTHMHALLRKCDSITQSSMFLRHSHIPCSETSKEDWRGNSEMINEVTDNNEVNVILITLF